MIVLTYCENNLLNIKLKIKIELTNNKLDFITIEYIIQGGFHSIMVVH